VAKVGNSKCNVLKLDVLHQYYIIQYDSMYYTTQFKM